MLVPSAIFFTVQDLQVLHHFVPAGRLMISRASLTAPAARAAIAAVAGDVVNFVRSFSRADFQASPSHRYSVSRSRKKRTSCPSWTQRPASQLSRSAARSACHIRRQASSHNAMTPSGSKRLTLTLRRSRRWPVHSGGTPFLARNEAWMWSMTICHGVSVFLLTFTKGGGGAAFFAASGPHTSLSEEGTVTAGGINVSPAAVLHCPALECVVLLRHCLSALLALLEALLEASPFPFPFTPDHLFSAAVFARFL